MQFVPDDTYGTIFRKPSVSVVGESIDNSLYTRTVLIDRSYVIAISRKATSKHTVLKLHEVLLISATTLILEAVHFHS